LLLLELMQMPPVAERLRALLGVNVDELAGTRVAGELLIPTAVANRVIAARLAQAAAPIAAVHVVPRQDNVIDADVTASSRLVPRLRVQAMVERQPEFPDNPRLVLRWRIPVAGMLARLAAPTIANLKGLPPGVRIDADFVVIDLREVLASQGQSDLLAYVRGLRIETRGDGFVVKYELGVG
jgi:hypothetical protein